MPVRFSVGALLHGLLLLWALIPVLQVPAVGTDNDTTLYGVLGCGGCSEEPSPGQHPQQREGRVAEESDQDY